jgi:steroid 5-alpha reductase family enzyme
MALTSGRYSKIYSITAVFIIYTITLLLLTTIAKWLPYSSSIYRVLVLDIAGTFIIFGFSFVFKNSSIYDPYWSVVPLIIAVYLVETNPQGNFQRQIILFAIIALWGIRLTFNWIKSWDGLNKQDWRYTKLANDTGKFYWLVSLFGIHLMPTLVVFAGLLPCWFTFSSTEPLNVWDGLAALFTLSFIGIEWTADSQLRSFRRVKTSGAFLKEGLWSYCRHPNYLGEIGFWLGLSLFLWSSKSYSGIWAIIGFVSMLILFKFISIPMMDKRNLERRVGYKEYIETVPSLLPVIRKRI